MNRWWPRTAIAGAILAAHMTALGGIFWIESREVSSDASTSETVFATAEIIQLQDARYKVPAPDLLLVKPALPVTAPLEIPLDESIEDELAAVVSPASAPRLARVQSVDPASFARRAHLPPGRPFTVVLRVQIMEDGLVSAVDVIRTSDNAAADAAAIDYALELRWIPGTSDRKPKATRVSFPITLVYPEAPSNPHHNPTLGTTSSSNDD
jgi:hypothetical protein